MPVTKVSVAAGPTPANAEKMAHATEEMNAEMDATVAKAVTAVNAEKANLEIEKTTDVTLTTAVTEVSATVKTTVTTAARKSRKNVAKVSAKEKGNFPK